MLKIPKRPFLKPKYKKGSIVIGTTKKDIESLLNPFDIIKKIRVIEPQQEQE